MTKLPPYLIAAAEELNKALTANPYVDASLSVKIQDSRPVHVEITATVKHKPENLTGQAGARHGSR